MLGQFLPNQHQRVLAGKLENDPRALIQNRIDEVLADYDYACGNP